jgi:uncharacterized membrane protein YgcG
MSQLNERKKDLQEKIDHYMSLNTLATDGQFPDSIRPAKYVIDAVKFIKQVQAYTQEVLNIVKAIQQVIGMYQSMLLNMQGYFQARLNALATLMNEICNFHLPTLPSIPNFFGNFHFDGFTFPKGAFKFKLSFDKNFAFGQCKLRLNTSSLFSNYPKTMDWGSIPTTGPIYSPPFNGSLYDGLNPDPNTVSGYTDRAYYTDFDPSTDYYRSPFSGSGSGNGNGSGTGGTGSGTGGSGGSGSGTGGNNGLGNISGFPNPSKIISNYHMPIDLYTERLSSLTGIKFYLRDVVVSDYDPNFVAGWLLLLSNNRALRRGDWLPRYQDLYNQYLQPSIDYIQNNGISWNNRLNGPGPVAGDVNIPLISILTNNNATKIGQLLYMFTFIETSLLGNSRNKDYDLYAIDHGTDLDPTVSSFLTDIVGEDTDYLQYLGYTGELYNIPLDSGGKAKYPTFIKVPRNLAPMLNSIVYKLSIKINAQKSFVSQRPKYRYAYDNFGNQVLIDMYSQYWRELADNWNTLFNGRSDYSDSIILSYETTIEETIDPLSSKTTVNRVNQDSNTRSRTWLPGAWSLPEYVPSELELHPPTHVSQPNDCWHGDTLLEDKFLLRADIQGLSLNQKVTMLQINKAYSALRANMQSMTQEIQAAIAAASAQQLDGYTYDVEQIQTVVDTGSDVVFNKEEFDSNSWYQDGISFKVPTSGSYSIAVTSHWPMIDVGTRILTIIKNTDAILETKQSDPGPGPIELDCVVAAELVAGDVIRVRASHNCLVPQTIDKGTFACAMVGGSGNVNPVPDPGTGTSSGGGVSSTTDMVASTHIFAGSCVKINEDKSVSVLDPMNDTVSPFIDGVALTEATAGNKSTIAYIHGSIYTIDGLGFVPGPVFLGASGSLTQVQPTKDLGYKWYVQVGRAVNSDTIIMDSQLPIFLNF